MPPQRTCPECGLALPPDSPHGLCPRCLLSGAGSSLAPVESVAAGSQSTVTASARLSHEKPGDQIGRYKLLEKLGEGGCGIVYMARQEEPVKRLVALKVIKLGMDTRQVIARFEAERQALALMDHPHIAKVLDGGATSTGSPYFVMELVRGISITRYCDENRLDTTQRLELFILVCQAVQHAHQKGIIHRDIKPSNILVAEHDGTAIPKVIDFGIAKATTGQTLTDKTLFTAFEQFMGTPAYMSPEQAKLTGLDIDTRTDIYSLGVLLYELLTGKPPFEAKRLMKAGLEEICRIIREEEPPKPSTRLCALEVAEQTTLARQRQTETLKLAGLVRGDLDWIVMKTLEKDRTRRYATANGLAADLNRFLKNEPVIARPPSHAYRLQKLVKRHQLTFAALVAVVAALAIGLIVSTWLFIQERAAREAAKAEATKSQQAFRFLEDMLQGVGPSKAKGRDTKMVREILDMTSARISKELVDQPLVQAKLQTTLGDVYLALGELKKAEAMIKSALATRRKLLGTENQDTAGSLSDLAAILDWQGKPREAEASAREAITIQKRLLRPDHPDIGQSLNTLATAVAHNGDLSGAIGYMREAIPIYSKAYGEKSAKVATLLDNLGSILRAHGDLKEAEEAHTKSLAILRKVAGEDDLDTISALRNLASVLRFEGRLQDSETLQREALDHYHHQQLKNHPDVAAALNDLAGILQAEGKLPEAETNLDESIEIAIAVFGKQSTEVGISLSNLGALLYQEKLFAKAEPKLRDALTILEAQLPKDAPDVLICRNNLAATLQRVGKAGEAEPLARSNFDIRNQKWPQDLDTFIASKRLGLILLDLKRYADAETFLLSSYEGLKRMESSLSPRRRKNLIDACQSLVQLYQSWDKAEPNTGRALQASEWRRNLEVSAQVVSPQDRSAPSK
jgi:eukaryotic-like serine/threonine-protein kinase